MKAVTISVIKKELQDYTQDELIQVCLKLAKFKTENKELLTYLLFESHNEDEYIETIKAFIEDAFEDLNQESLYYFKKGVRKILRLLKKYIRYSKKKETEAELLIYFCAQLKEYGTLYKGSTQMQNLYDKQLEMANKAINRLNEDLQFAFYREIEDLEL